MKFLIVLVVITFVALKSIFGFVELSGELVYKSSHTSETYLAEIE